MQVARLFTRDDIDVEAMFTWTRRKLEIKEGNRVVFSGEVEAPDFWSDLAVTVAAKTWFRTIKGVRETSIKSMIWRVVNAIAAASEFPDVGFDYFAGNATERKIFRDELFFICAAQYALFNTPVWVNVGVSTPKHTVPRVLAFPSKRGGVNGAYRYRAPNVGPQASACFIQGVTDTMEGLCELQTTETQLFRRSSGTGSNMSPLRPANSPLSGGGTSSGPVSFMRGLDGWAGVTKSGGSARRAAVMRVLDIYHPDIHDFINVKSLAQKAIRDLGLQGWDVNYNGIATTWMPYQNANNSVRVDDAFMAAAAAGNKVVLHWPTQWDKLGDAPGSKDFATRPLHDVQIRGNTVEASSLLREIATAAHDCGDPGIQFDTTINKWHTCPQTGRIDGSNPCCLTGDMLVDTNAGPLSFAELVQRQNMGEDLPYAFSYDTATGLPVWRKIKRVWQEGQATQLLEIVTVAGATIRCTPEHPFLLQSGQSVEAQSLRIGDQLRKVKLEMESQEVVDSVASLRRFDADEPVFDIEVDGTHNFGVWSPETKHSIVVHNSEYMFLNDSACNLASLRLTKFLKTRRLPTGQIAYTIFDLAEFKHVARLMFIAQEVLVGAASYPTEKIAQNSHDFRPLGLGYCDLGALLMQQGVAYDSNMGRDVCAAVTALLGGVAYATSAELSRQCGGPFQGYALNAEPMLNVIKMHNDEAVKTMREAVVPVAFEHIHGDVLAVWQQALTEGTAWGFRNSQVTVLAPTGSIGLAMDCDTTGIEPDTALVKYKRLAGGGTVEIVNGSVEKALQSLGYDEATVQSVVATVKSSGKLPDTLIKQQDRAVFATAFGQPGNEISVDGHLKMMAAAQPFLSGAISKTVNLPKQAAIEDIEGVFVQAWKLGLKAVAIYRDGCKDQPLQAKSTQDASQLNAEATAQATAVTATTSAAPAPTAQRRRLPQERPGLTRKFTIGGVDGYIHLGLYPDGGVGEIFIDMEPRAKAYGLDLIMQAASVALQRGEPLDRFVERWLGTEFEPRGFTGEGADGIPYATSPLDYLAKWLQRRDVGVAVGEAAPVVVAAVAAAPVSSGLTKCPRCSAAMRRDGACLQCPTCGYGQGGCGG